MQAIGRAVTNYVFPLAVRTRHFYSRALFDDGERLHASFVRCQFRHHLLPLSARKRGGHAAKRGTSAEQIPVLVSRDRAGNTADAILKADDKACVVAALKPLLPKDVILCSDGSSTLAAAAKSLGVVHRPIKLSAGIRVVAGIYHVQNVNAYDSRLKAWIRRFHGVATRYLDSYLGWFRAIDRSGCAGLNPVSMLASAIRV